MKFIQTDKAPGAIGPYSQATVSNGFIFCSGQIGLDPQTKTLVEGIEEQTRQVIKNLEEVLTAAGSDLQHVVKTTIYVTDVNDFAKVNAIYEECFGDHKPARATVEVSNLPKGKLPEHPMIEIEAIGEIFKS